MKLLGRFGKRGESWDDVGDKIYQTAEKTFGKGKLDAWLSKMKVQKTDLITETKSPQSKNLYPTSEAQDRDNKKKSKDVEREARGIREISGGGTQIRNVQVVIQKQIEKVEVITTNMQDASVGKIKKILEELLVTSVRDAELALGH
jgi:hypothetical protein